MEDFLRKSKKVIPNLAGVKFSSKDLVDMIGCVFQDKMNVLFGCDEVSYKEACMVYVFR